MVQMYLTNYHLDELNLKKFMAKKFCTVHKEFWIFSILDLKTPAKNNNTNCNLIVNDSEK